MLNSKKTVIGALILTLLTGAAAASPANVDIFPSQSSTRIDHFTEFEVTVENTGPTKDIYEITSSVPSEIRIKPEEVSLEPGTEETVNLWYDPMIDKDEGTYSFSITATSQASGQSYSDQATVSVIKEHKVDLTVDRSSKTGCLGEQVKYDLQVTNTGIQQEAFDIRTDKGTLSRNSVNLEDDETQNVTLTISSNSPVQQNFNVVASSQESYADDIQNIDFQAERCWDSAVSITPESKETAAKTETEFDVTVRNKGTKSDTFTLSTKMGELAETNLEINAKSSKTTTLSMTPQELGQTNLKVTAESEVTSSDTASLNSFNGMDMKVEIGESRTNVCEDEDAEIEAVVENTGATTESYSLSTSLGTLEEDQVELDAGEDETVDIEVNSSSMTPGTYPVEFTATAESFGGPEKSASSNLVINNCWDLSMEVIPSIANIEDNQSIIYEINLRNNGTEENTYELSEDGPSWVSIKPSSVTVQPSETKQAYIYAGIPYNYNGTLEITSEAEGTEVVRSETVKLTSEEAEEAREGGIGLTGSFIKGMNNIVSSISSPGQNKVLLSILIGLGITALVLLREW